MSLYLLGAKPGVAELAAKNLAEKNPGLKIAGVHDGYFKEDGPIVAAIRESGADCVFVCLGAPKQEKWMNEFGPACGASLFVGLGGSLDVFAGHVKQDVAATLGDFPIARDEFGAGYTLAVVVDDAAMGVSEVVRGDDLLPATPAQILLQRALGLPTPDYCHVPLVVGGDGRRLAKRHGDTRIAAYRAAGVSPEEIVGRLGASCGWCVESERVSLRELVGRFDLVSIPKEPLRIASDGDSLAGEIWYNTLQTRRPLR
jgi:hypothetical protein